MKIKQITLKHQQGKHPQETHGSWADDPSKPLDKRISSLRSRIAKAAQEVYDNWHPEDEYDEYSGGGICDDVSRAIGGILVDLEGVSTVDGGQDGDDHAFIVAYTDTDAFAVDIPPSVYERGGGYSWEKVEGVEIDPDDIEIYPISRGDLGIEDDEYKSYKSNQKSMGVDTVSTINLQSLTIKHHTGNPDHDSPEGQKRHGRKKSGISKLYPEKRIRGYEKVIAGDNTESAILMCSDGEVVTVNGRYNQEYNSHEVEYTDEDMTKVRGGILTHNHPLGFPFSVEDIAFAGKCDLEEIRAVGRSIYDGKMRLYKAKRPKGGWKEVGTGNVFKVADAIDDVSRHKIWPLVKLGEMTPDHADFVHHMLRNKQLHDYGYMEFSVEELDD